MFPGGMFSSLSFVESQTFEWAVKENEIVAPITPPVDIFHTVISTDLSLQARYQYFQSPPPRQQSTRPRTSSAKSADSPSRPPACALDTALRSRRSQRSSPSRHAATPPPDTPHP